MRYSYRANGSSFLPDFIHKNDFSVVQMLLVISTWFARVIENIQRSRELIRLMIITDAPAPGVAPIPPPAVGAPIPPQDGVAQIQGNGDEIVEADVIPQGEVDAQIPEGAGNVQIQGNGDEIQEEAGHPQIPQVVGNAQISDSTLVNDIIKGNNNQMFIQKYFDLWSVVRSINGREVTLNLWTLKEIQDDHPINWRLPLVDFIVLHFSLINKDSFQNVTSKRSNFLTERAPNARIILVGTDRAERNKRQVSKPITEYFVTSMRGERLALKIKAIAYEETDVVSTRGEEESAVADTQGLVDRLAKLMI